MIRIHPRKCTTQLSKHAAGGKMFIVSNKQCLYKQRKVNSIRIEGHACEKIVALAGCSHELAWMGGAHCVLFVQLRRIYSIHVSLHEMNASG